LLSAHRKAHLAGREEFTDDASLAEWAGITVATFEGEVGNVKLTTAEDFLRAEAEHSCRPWRHANGFLDLMSINSAKAIMSCWEA